MTVSCPGVHYITVYTAKYREYNNTGQSSEYTRLNNHFGHNSSLLRDWNILRFLISAISIDPQNSAKIRQPQKIPVIRYTVT